MVAGIGHFDGTAAIAPGNRRRGLRLNGMDEGAERGENRLLRLDGPFLRTGVTDDTGYSVVKPISGHLPLASHPFRSRNPPPDDSCNVYEASYAACSPGLHDRHRLRCDGRELVQFAPDIDYLLAGKKRHQIQEVNPKLQERPALTWYR